MSSPLALLIFSVSLAQVSAINFPGPSPTLSLEALQRAAEGWTPKPTTAPLRIDLMRRDEAFYDTCGWDQTSGAVTCPIGTCMFYEPSGQIGMAGCCTSGDLQNCGWKNTCYDYRAISAGKCNSDCFRNSFARLCSNKASPYCQSWTYPAAQIKDYGCATDGASTYTTMAEFSTDDWGSTYIADPTVLSRKEVTGWETTASATSKSNPAAEASQAQTSIQPSPTSSKSSVPIGAIAGGAAAGGVVLIAIVTGLIIFFVMRNKKKSSASGGQPYAQVPPGGSGVSQDPRLSTDPRMSAYPPQGPPERPPSQEGYFTSSVPSYPQDQKEAVMANVYQVPTPTSNGSSPPVPDYYKHSQPTSMQEGVPMQPIYHPQHPQQLAPMSNTTPQGFHELQAPAVNSQAPYAMAPPATMPNPMAHRYPPHQYPPNQQHGVCEMGSP
ncbi:hypothetical protein NA57DRAFT_73293 [Rhizodiscina lignyota]|uniref:Uncharacterized protein n=1 Tax=Rhizodiscina lignyota TaxID=1504668 RepID=A0A9P4ILZ0_9PEZI|nr:hypothetical protein NA57DRAFT_73293 [Rhizodiscina lignyota]